MKRRTVINIVCTFAWVVMAFVLLIFGVLICAFRLLSPEVLTPVAENYANRVLNARVSIGRVELAAKPAFPHIVLKIDSLSILSDAFEAEELTALPDYADTLFTLGRFEGSLNLLPLLSRGEIAVGDVELLRPSMNIVIDSNGKGNFDIYKTSDTDTPADSVVQIPAFSIHRFAFVDPGTIRYFNAVDSAEATVVLLSTALIDGHEEPRYGIRVEGRLGGPGADVLNLDNVGFGLDGHVHWNPEKPQMLALEDFTVYGAFITAKLETALEYGKTLTVSTAALEVEPVKIADIISILPEATIKEYGLTPSNFATDASVAFAARLARPFCVATDSIPFAVMTLTIPDSYLRYGKADIRKLALDAKLELRGNDLDSAEMVVDRFRAVGPATSLEIAGKATRLRTDPVFEATLKGNMNLLKLPPVLSNRIPGYLTGALNFELEARGAKSMLDSEKIHLLDIRGDLIGRDLYFLSSDTAKMAEIDGLKLKFGSNIKSRKNKTNMLAAHLEVDTAALLIDGVNVNIGELTLGAGAENAGRPTDTTLVVPVGGGLKVKRLTIESITDSAGVRMRNISGRVGLTRFKGYKKLPQLSAKLEIGLMAAGTTDTRFLLRKAKVQATTYKNVEKLKQTYAIKQAVDSIKLRHPHLTPDSVYRLALAKRRHKPGQHRKKRVHEEMTEQDLEIIDWGVSKGLTRFLYNWELHGTLTTRNAGLYSPFFPLRNRMRSLDVVFSTDTVELRGVTYRAGRSDLDINGRISNIRRGLTARSVKAPLKINFDISSDTIDVNELAAAVFAGSAYAERLRRGERAIVVTDSEDDFEKQIDAIASEHPDSVGPLLIPSNIEGQVTLISKNVLYDQLLLKNLRGNVLIYDGAMNFHNIGAHSDAGDMNLSALYAAPKADQIKFGFGLQLNRFKIERFLHLVPAVDSIMPIMRDFSGIINADIAATVDIDSAMNMELPTLDAAVRLSGDSLAFINPETYRTLGKWLRFRDKADNTIKHISVEMIVKDNMLHVFPFYFDIDRYRLGILGYNDLDLNFDYHIAVLKSPLPFRFGITLKGNPDKYKVRFGGPKFKEDMVNKSVHIVDTARVSLVKQIENVFRRGVRNARFASLTLNAPKTESLLDERESKLSATDSLQLIQEGILPAQEAMTDSVPSAEARREAIGNALIEKARKKRKKRNEKR